VVSEEIASADAALTALYEAQAEVTRLMAENDRLVQLLEQAETAQRAWTEIGAREQAGAAVLRAALEQAMTLLPGGTPDTLDPSEYTIVAACDAALATDAGRTLLAERRKLLVVAYEAWRLSNHIEEFDTVVDAQAVDDLDAALLKAFGLGDVSQFLEAGARIEDALGGYEQALKARRE
jgi:hypothetical protein